MAVPSEPGLPTLPAGCRPHPPLPPQSIPGHSACSAVHQRAPMPGLGPTGDGIQGEEAPPWPRRGTSHLLPPFPTLPQHTAVLPPSQPSAAPYQRLWRHLLDKCSLHPSKRKKQEGVSRSSARLSLPWGQLGGGQVVSLWHPQPRAPALEARARHSPVTVCRLVSTPPYCSPFSPSPVTLPPRGGWHCPWPTVAHPSTCPAQEAGGNRRHSETSSSTSPLHSMPGQDCPIRSHSAVTFPSLPGMKRGLFSTKAELF